MTIVQTRMFWLFFYMLITSIIPIQAQQASLVLDSQLDCNSNSLCVIMAIQSSSTSLELGNASIFIDYDEAALAFTSYTASAFSASKNCENNSINGWDLPKYRNKASSGSFNLSLILKDASNNCPAISATPIEIGVVCFTILDNTLDPAISIINEYTLFNNAATNDGTQLIPFELVNNTQGTTLLGDCNPLCEDADADGICDEQDQCPNFDDKLIGTPCDDQNEQTINDEIINTCTCIGELNMDTNSCTAAYSLSDNTVTVNGLVDPISSLQILDASWKVIYQCDTWSTNPCETTEIVANLEGGDYFVSISTFDSSWNRICNLLEPITVSGATTSDNIASNSVSNRSRNSQSNPTIAFHPDIQVFPNPASQEIVVSLPDGMEQKGTLHLYDQVGSLIFSTSLKGNTHKTLRLDIGTLTSGIHTLSLLSDNGAISSKLFVVEN